MSVWLKVILIVFAAALVSVGVGFIPPKENEVLPPLPPLLSQSAIQQALKPADPLLEALLFRPPRTALDACSPTVKNPFGLTHADFVHIAACLYHRHLVSAHTVAAVKRSKLLGDDPSRGFRLQTKTDMSLSWWLWLLTWSLALALIVVVVSLHVRRGPPGGAPLRVQ